MNPEAFPVIKVVEPLKRVGKAVTWFFTAHQLSEHGDHFIHDSLATPVQPVTELRQGVLETELQVVRMQAYWQGFADANGAVIERAIDG